MILEKIIVTRPSIITPTIIHGIAIGTIGTATINIKKNISRRRSAPPLIPDMMISTANMMIIIIGVAMAIMIATIISLATISCAIFGIYVTEVARVVMEVEILGAEIPSIQPRYREAF